MNLVGCSLSATQDSECRQSSLPFMLHQVMFWLPAQGGPAAAAAERVGEPGRVQGALAAGPGWHQVDVQRSPSAASTSQAGRLDALLVWQHA